MNEIIASILDAEQKAEEIVKNSTETSKRIKQSADEEGERIKNGAVAVFKLHRVSAIKDAEKLASKEYNAIIDDGKNRAEEISKTTADKIDFYAERIVKDITG